jgi:signal recognition particle receptor subunit beta
MAFLNEDTNELHIKILYAGASGSGKTTNLQSLFKQTSSEISSQFFDLHSIGGNSQFFDFLPLTYGKTQSHALRLHLFTLPSHDLWPTVNMNLCQGVDGIVGVVDSRLPFLEDNEAAFARVKNLLHLTNRSFSEIPLVFQYNHRDAPNAVDLEGLRKEYSRHGAGEIEAIAAKDTGVLETLESIAERVLTAMENETPSWQDRESFGLQ